MIITTLRSFIFNIAFFMWSMLSSLIFAPLFFISTKAALKSGWPWAYGVLLLARVLCGIRYEIRGREYITDGPVFYASKHQSAWDTAIFWKLLKEPAFILKRELLRIPLWGWYLWRMQMIAIDRSAGGAGLKDMIRQSKIALSNGRPIIIFPEGTRTKPGAPPNYHPGILALYNQLKIPVIPVALNSGMYWSKNAFNKHPGTIIIEFLPPIAPGLSKEDFRARLQSAIENASQKLQDEANNSNP